MPPGRLPALPFSPPTLDGEFAPSDALRLHFTAASKRPAVALRTLVEVLDARNRAVASYEPASVRTIDLEIPLKALGAGAYILRATIADAAHGASREVGFVVR